MELFSDDANVLDLARAIKLFKESRTAFLTVFNNSPICMSMTTTTLGRRVYVRVNKKFIEKFGFAEDEIIGKSSIEIGILDEKESIRVGAIIKEKGRLQNDYVKCISKSGEIVHTVSSIEIMDINDATYLVSFFVDITKIIDQQAIIELHAKQLEAVNRELEAFSYSVSHDLRAPLRAIHSYTSSLEEDYGGQMDDEKKKLLDAVLRNARKMETLIEALLSFARLGKKELFKTEIDMNRLVQEVLAEVKTGADVRTEITVGNLHPLPGDYELMKQVMINLIANGIKYSSKKERPALSITSQAENDQVTVTLKDNGDGFDMQYAHKLFGVFQRLHSAHEFEGTGVGLAMVQRIINRHGGTIRAEAEVGKGATFIFSLPSK